MCLNYLLKPPSPNTITLESGFQHINFGGDTNIWSIASHLPLPSLVPVGFRLRVSAGYEVNDIGLFRLIHESYFWPAYITPGLLFHLRVLHFLHL